MGKILRYFILISFFIVIVTNSVAQSSQEFWFAAPTVTVDHGAGNTPILLRFTSTSSPANIVIDMPANPGFAAINIVMPAFSSHTEDLSAFVSAIMTPSNDAVNNNGLHIVSTATITCYYEVDTQFNPEIWALKGGNGLGQEFYVAVQNEWTNGNYSPDFPYTSFDIVATEDNTVVSIYPKTDLDFGHSALTPYTIFLDQGETYSGSIGQFDQSIPASENPVGAVIVSTKDIAVSVKDDSVNPAAYGGCRDIMGDQLVPTDILGMEYIATKGFLNLADKVYILAIENNTQVSVDGVLQATLFGSEMYTYDLNNPVAYVSTNKPVYVYQASGFGCEVGMAILPPLNCAGSEEVSFTRSSSERFGLNILIRAGSEGDFELNGDPNIIVAGDFSPVPSNTDWVYAQKVWANNDVSVIPTGTAQRLTNSSSVFALGLINGGNTSGCRFGYFSEFSAEVVVDAGPDDVVCGNDSLKLNGIISGGSIQGFWASSGTGTFIPDENQLDAIYAPSVSDEANGSVTLTLTSTGSCFPEIDQLVVAVTPSPTIDLGPDLDACSNNPDILLTATTTVATNAIWSGGNGNFIPSNVGLSVTYQPTVAEVLSGSIDLSAQSAGQGTCNPVEDFITINFTPSPTVNTGGDQSVCENNADVILGGSVTLATGGIWSGGSGVFTPSTVALNATYSPTTTEISSGSVTLTLTTTGNGNCNAETDQLTITFTSAPVVNAGVDNSFCKNNSDISLSGSVSGATGAQWTGGLGSFNPDNQTLNATYSPSAAELAAGSVTLTLESTGNGTCLVETDNVTYIFTPSPTVDAGLDQNVCENNADIILNGSVTIANGGQWSGGSGSYSPNSTNLNATYSPTAAEIASGSMKLYLTTTGNGSCNSEIDSLTISFTTGPTANAGNDQSVCANNSDVSLSGSVSVATGGLWSGGNGFFTPSTAAMNAVYTPTLTEISNGSLTLTLTTTGNGLCNSETDQVTITFTPAPVVNAGIGGSFCSNNADISLNGSVSGATGGQWTGALGSFDPDNQTLNAVYSPSASELANGSVTLTLESTGNGTCNTVSDMVTYTFTPSPTVEAGVNQSVCENNADVILNGSVTIATGGQWSGGNGIFNPNAGNLNATYFPTAAEIAAGSMKLYLTTTGNALCNSETDSLTITFTPAPTSNAGPDQTVCANNTSVNLNGSVIGATGGQWSGGSGSYNPSGSVPNPTYTPSALEISAGSVTLTFSTTGNGNCNAVSDDILITITDAPVVNAGNDLEYCSNNSTIPLNGSVNGATGGVWSGGLGIFDPDNQTLNAIYTPSAAEVSFGTIILTLTSTGNGSCIATEDLVTFTFGPSPVVDAGSDVDICADNASIPLSGQVGIAGGGQWSGGSGTFVPNAFNLNATYIASAADISTGQITLYLTSTSNGNCNAAIDSLLINFEPIAGASAGNDQSSCANSPAVLLDGTVTGAPGGLWSGGSGVFNPSNSSLNATYIPSPAEIIAGSVTLTLTTAGSVLCSDVSDNMIITINPSPIVNAGGDQEACANNPNIQLSGSVQFASGAEWSGGNGTFSPSSSSLNALYIPTAAEISSGNLVLNLTSTGNGSCNAEFDQVLIFFTPAPTVNAGLDESLCANNATVNLIGSVIGASGGVWSGGLGTFTPSNTSLVTDYEPHPSEISNGSVTLTLTSTGNGTCSPESSDIIIDFTDSPVVNAGSDVTNCVDDLDVPLNGSVSGPTTTGVWSTSGTGFFVPNNFDLSATYVISSQDSINGGATIYLSSSNNGNCSPVVDSLLVNIFPVGEATAGNDQTVCANNNPVQLDGQISGAATSGVWSSAGSGVFTPNNQTLDAVYTPSNGDILNGSVVLTLTANACNDATDQVTISYSPAPSVFAGEDQTVCITDLDVTLNGFVSGGASTGVWISTGTGMFIPDASTLNAVYQLSSEDSLDQNVILILTSTGNGDCFAVADSMEINVFPPGVADAGEDAIICSNDDNVQLNGAVSGGANIGQWSTSGSGIFLPNDTDLNGVYQPSDQDNINGSVTLTLTTVNSCNMANDQMELTIIPGPKVTTYNDTTVCGTNPILNLVGDIQNANGGVWSTSGTGTFTNNTNLVTDYTASADDVLSGLVTLTLTSTGNGLCNEESSSFDLNFSDGIFVSAGDDQQICVSAIETTLNGTINNGSSTGFWTTTGDGTFSDNNDLHATYIIGPTDIASGIVTFTLESTNNGNCAVETDQMELTFGNTVFVFAGDDDEFCADINAIQLDGVISGGSSTGIWSSSGTGIFNPDNATLDAMYIPSAGDSILGAFKLILVSTNNGGCLEGRDSVDYLLSPLPFVDAGEDQVICAGSDTVLLSGTEINTDQILWTSNGSGVFDPNANTIDAIYIASAADKENGIIEFILYSLDSDPCGETSDDLTISFAEDLTAIAGSDIATCADNLTIQLNGLVSGTSTGEWSTTGSGFFSPGPATLNAQYIASQGDALVGQITLYLSTTNTMDCPNGIDSLLFTIDPVPIANAGDDITVCEGTEEVQLQGSLTNSNGGTWASDGSGTFVPSANELDAIYVFSAQDQVIGSVTITLSTELLGVCAVNIDTMIVDLLDPLIADFSWNGQCELNTIQFSDQTIINAGTIESFEWIFDDGDQSQVQNPAHVYNSSGTYDVELIVHSNLGCNDTTVLQVQIFENPVSGFNYEETENNFEVQFFNEALGASLFDWTFGDDVGFSEEENPTYQYQEFGVYSVTQVVTNEFGCIDSLSQAVNVTNSETVPPKTPDAFSPNDDGVNDVFYVRGGPFTKMNLKIYDGWGENIYESDEIEGGWDGSYKGQKVQMGVYIYIVDAIGENGNVYKIQGNVTVIK